MKKLAIALCLVGILVGSAVGSMALADKGGIPNYGSSPLGDIEEISEKIDNLIQNAEEVLEGIGNVTRMEVLSGNKTLEGLQSWVPVFEEYPEVRHVSLTVASAPIEAFDSVTLCYGVGATYMCEYLVLPSDRLTLEFNTDRWELAAANANVALDLHLSYAATVTYVQ